MSSFERALPYVLKNEGGIYDARETTGEYTFKGISQKFLILINYRTIDPTLLSDKEISDLYEKYFWNQYHLGLVNNHRESTKIFDMYVNMTPEGAGRCVQNSINSCILQKPGIESLINVDSILGPKTLAALNDCDPTNFLANLISNLEGYYKAIAIGNNKGNLAGWLKRARELPS